MEIKQRWHNMAIKDTTTKAINGNKLRVLNLQRTILTRRKEGM